jgi:hypothetical protein
MKQQLPSSDAHIRPEGVTDEAIEGLGKLSEGLEKIERARGALYEFHQLIGGADITISESADILEQAGFSEQAETIRTKVVGRNLLAGRWSFQIVEEFDDGYYRDVKDVEKNVRDTLVEGKRHIYESEMKEANRTRGLPGHEARPE